MPASLDDDGLSCVLDEVEDLGQVGPGIGVGDLGSYQSFPRGSVVSLPVEN